MKKTLLLSAFTLLGLAVKAQTTAQFKAGAHVGIPVGDASKAYSFNAGVDLAYTWMLAENFNLGVTTGYSHYFSKDITYYTGIGENTKVTFKGVDGGIIPIAATAQYSISPNFFIGADLGYGIATNKDGKGGFYYQPKVGYQQSNWELYAGYKGISRDGGTLGSVNLGFNFKFK